MFVGYCFRFIIWIECCVVLYSVVSTASWCCIILVCGSVFGPSAAGCHFYCCWIIVGCCFHFIIWTECWGVLHIVVLAASWCCLFLVCGSIFRPSAARCNFYCCWMIKGSIIWVEFCMVLYCVVSGASWFYIILVCGSILGLSAVIYHFYCCWIIVGLCF